MEGRRLDEGPTDGGDGNGGGGVVRRRVRRRRRDRFLIALPVRPADRVNQWEREMPRTKKQAPARARPSHPLQSRNLDKFNRFSYLK